jgi:hypothetical protein
MMNKVLASTFLFLTLFIQAVSAYELGIISMFKNEACNLREWVEYHRLVGVEHFWLYNNLSTDNWEEELAPYIKSGLLEVFDWQDPNWPASQVHAFKDGLQKAHGRANWVAVIDMDEFILPLCNKTVPECLKEHFSNASGVFINWRNFGTSHITLPKNKPFLFKLISCSLASHPLNAVGKSIVQPDKVRLEDVWCPHHFPLQAECVYVNGDNIPMKFSGIDLHSDGKHHDKYIRINHYILRDEDYFHKVRLGSRNPEARTRAALMEQYVSFSATKDKKILSYLMRKHPKKCKEIWEVDPKN